jgi:hypothetical protein
VAPELGHSAPNGCAASIYLTPPDGIDFRNVFLEGFGGLSSAVGIMQKHSENRRNRLPVGSKSVILLATAHWRTPNLAT